MMHRFYIALFLILGFAQGLQAQRISIPLRTDRGAEQRVVRHRAGVGMSMQLSFSTLRVDVDMALNGQRFASLSLDGAYPAGIEGCPALPAVRRLVGIPHGATPTVRLVAHRVQEIALSDHGIRQPVAPLQPPRRKGLPADSLPFAYNPQAYTANAYLLPDSVVSIRVLGTMRGVAIAQVEVRAVNYNPAAGKLLVYNDLDIHIDCHSASGAGANQRCGWASPYFDALFGLMPMLERGGEQLAQVPVRMLVVAHRMFEQTLRPFVRWKQQRGFQVDVAYTDHIGTTRDDIKRYVHGVYNDATAQNPAPTFLLIVGDVEQVPASAIGSETERCTDLYYASTDGDFLPEMLYGRMSAQTPEHLQNIIEKILYYERYSFSDASYLNRATLIAGADDVWNPVAGQPAIRYATRYYFNPQRGYTSVYEYGVEGDPNNPAAQADYAGCYGAEQLRVGYFNYTAHGSETSWLAPALSTSSVINADNVQMYPFVVANCCLSADFGYMRDECLGETWIRAPQRGAVTYIGSAPSSYWYNDAYWAMGAFEASKDLVDTDFESSTLGAYDAPFHSDYVSAAGIMFAGNLAVTQADNADYLLHKPALYYWQAYNVLGDPSLTPYFTEGRPMQVDYQREVPVGLSVLEVHAPTGATVALSSDTALFAVAQADEHGLAHLVLPNVQTTCRLSLVVTKPQAIPYIGSVRVQPAKGAFVVASAVEPVAAQSLFGTSFQVSAMLRNVGAANSGALSISISTSDAYVDCIDNHQTLADIAPDVTATVPNIATIALAPNIPDGHRVLLRLTVANADTAWTSLCWLTARAPVLSIESILMRSDANSNEVFDVGETAQICVRVRNSGSAAASNAVVRLQAQHDAVNSVGAASQTVDIAPYSTTDVLFHFAADASIAPGTAVRFSAQAELANRLDTASVLFSVGTPQRVQAGSQERSVQQYPFYNYRQMGRTQILLHRHEVSLVPQTITHLQLYVNGVGALSRFNNLSISVLEVDINELPSTTFADTTGAKRVFYASHYDLPNSTGWIDFELSNGGFVFSGHRNLLIEFDFGPNTQTTMWGYYGFGSSETSFSSVIYEGRDLNTIGSNLRTANIRPNVGIVFAQTSPVSHGVDFLLRDEQLRPIAGARVQLGVASRSTDANGRVRFGTVLPVSLPYAVSHEHYVPMASTLRVDGDTLVALTLDRYNLLRFSITDTIAPLSGATLTINGCSHTTNSDGMVLVRLPDGAYTYAVAMPHHASVNGDVFVVNDTIDIVVRLTPDPRYNLVVTLVDEANQPIADATVQIAGLTKRTDAHGQAVFSLFGNDAYAYRLDAGSAFAADSGWWAIEQADLQQRIVLQRYRTVQFSITDGMRPLSGVTVQLANSEAYTNELGQASLRLVNGDYRYSLIRNGHISIYNLPLALRSDTLLSFAMSRRNMLMFVVTHHGVPVSDAMVMVNGLMLSTDMNGRADLRLVNDTYSFQVLHNDFELYQGSVELSNADVEVEVQLSQAAPMAIAHRQHSVLSIYPNPASTGFYVESDAAQLSIHRLDGSRVYSQSLCGRTYIDVSKLVSGIYIVRAGNAVAKLVKL